ncbi:MAG: AIR synthase-related protein, partial [Candidatus Dormibacteria bacterium]
EATVDRSRWQVPSLFATLAAVGEIPEEELWRTFNMGLGMICAVPLETAEAALAQPQLGLFEIGEVVARQGPDQVRLL